MLGSGWLQLRKKSNMVKSTHSILFQGYIRDKRVCRILATENEQKLVYATAMSDQTPRFWSSTGLNIPKRKSGHN